MIKKFDLNEDGPTVIQLNSYAKFLSIQIQNDIPRIWIIDEPFSEQRKTLQDYTINSYVTGDTSVGRGTYLGTLLLDNGAFVLHYFWR